MVAAGYGTGLRVDGLTEDWSGLSSGVVSLNTQGRGTNGTLAVDIRYAWDPTNLFVLVQENPSQYQATRAQEGTGASDYQTQPWLRDTIAFWLDLDNNGGGRTAAGGVIFENNADFQPWFGFSSAGRNDLVYARQNDSGTLNLGGVANAKVATSGTFTEHNRTIEIAMKWADIAGSVDSARQPGGDVSAAVRPGFVFGSEPLLISVDYNGQAFIGPDQWAPGSGTDAVSRDVRLEGGVRPVLSLTLTNWSGAGSKQLVLSWPGSFTGFTLESTPLLETTAWARAGSVFLDTDGRNKVLLPGIQPGAAYYRLREAP